MENEKIIYEDSALTERKKAQEENLKHILFLENLERVNKAIKQAKGVDEMLWAIVRTVFSIFNCDRAWLFFPCDPDSPSFRVPVEITKPEFPGAYTLNMDIPLTPEEAQNLREALSTDGPVIFIEGTKKPINTAKQFGVRSQMFSAIYPKTGKPWGFGMHQCSHPRIWNEEEIKLFKEIGRRLADGLTSALYLVELKKSEDHFRNTFEQAAMGIANVALNGQFMRVNRKLCEILGYSTEELQKKIVWDINYPDDLVSDREAFDQLLAGELPVYCQEKRYIRKDGTYVWVLLTASVSLADSESSKYFIFVVDDISERKKAAQQLVAINQELKRALARAEESDRLKSAFLSNMSHELRTPMNNIIGFAYLLKEPTLAEELRIKYAGMISSGSQRLQNTIDDILEISRLEAGQEKIAASFIQVNKLIHELYSAYKVEFSQNNIDLKIRENPLFDSLVILSDKQKIYHIFNNILSNALKFTKEGQVEFGFSLVGNDVEFFVKDSGIGIEKDKLALIFDRFFQVDISFNRTHEGSGLGLAISKGFVELLGGKIWVESIKGMGSIFKFTIPSDTLAKSLPISPFKSISNEFSNTVDWSQKTILVAEDELISYILIETILSKNTKVNILHAQNGIEVLDIFKNHPEIELIIMDLKMPLMDGFTATKKIREINKDIPIVAVTAYALEEEKARAIEAGCSNFISKPYDPNYLLSVLKTLIK